MKKTLIVTKAIADSTQFTNVTEDNPCYAMKAIMALGHDFETASQIYRETNWLGLSTQYSNKTLGRDLAAIDHIGKPLVNGVHTTKLGGKHHVPTLPFVFELEHPLI